ncbi:hypothetical protein VTI74DRAFT_6780 [Chaetomium olivicolor]
MCHIASRTRWLGVAGSASRPRAATSSGRVEQGVLPELTVNHTAYAPLAMRPLVLSIEMKAPHEPLLGAQVQLGVWHAAQWRHLGDVLRHHMRSGEDPFCPPTGTKDQHEEELLRRLPPFLPALSRKDMSGPSSRLRAHAPARSTLWVKQSIWSSDSSLGLYSIVCALQYLSRWVADPFWPWYRRRVLLPSRDEPS